ncbi:hypothetical protein [uncultured Treponema sp.]|uniref:hypothetical protein n=1 Tax=uncultured Treponema sp. TaxID=162155 RepID=UPI0025F80929|nr:hypothetical protein [uncultured Treponema sp.]
MIFRKIAVFTLLLFSAQFPFFSQKILRGNSLSQAVSKTLTDNGFTAISQNLSDTGQDEFAYNILLSFGSNTGDGESSFRNEVIFCFTQEDFSLYQNDLLDFLSYIRDLKRSWHATVLFSALDKSSFPGRPGLKGSYVFASSVDNNDSCCAVAVTLNSSDKTAIFTGSRRYTSPLWLTQRISDAFFYARTNFDFDDRLSAIYRLGIVNGQERLAFFFANSIPAIEINFSNPEQLNVLKKFSELYTPEGTAEWDIHYLYIDRRNIFRAIFIGERPIIISCLSVGLLTILILCIFSFTGINGERHKYEFIRSSYMIPATIFISMLSLYLGQYIASLLSSLPFMNPIILYGIKIIFSMILISMLFITQGIFRISLTAFMYGYLILIVAIINIFIFATRDLNLFVIFAAEYIIIYLSRSSRRLLSMIIYFLLMLMPFLPYGYTIIRNAEDRELIRTVFCNMSSNLVLAFAIFPFQIAWLRIMVLQNVYSKRKGYSLKKIILNGIFSTIAILVFIFILIFSISHFIYRPEFRKAQKIETKITRDEKFTLSAKLSKNEFSGMNTNHIKIESEKEALRYEVTLKGINTTHPIYDSIYDYRIITMQDGSDLYSFTIPDYPPKKITIDYASAVSTRAEIEITAYYETENENSFRIEKRVLTVE